MHPGELHEQLRGRISDEMLQWLQAACDLRGDRLLAAFVGAGRRLGGERLGGLGRLSSWPRSCAARVAMLLSLDEDRSEDSLRWITRAYREGDSSEKLAIMRALPWLRAGEHYLELALDCGRTNETELFAALALGNAFPASHYPEAAFNSLVIKAAQLSLPLEQIEGLLERKNPELARMSMEYIDERQSASRSFPPSLWLALAPMGVPGAVARMLGELQHSVAERRLGAVHGLALSGDARATAFLEERLRMERDQKVTEAIQKALNSKSS